MYRSPDVTRRCAVCGGTSVSAPTRFRPTEGEAEVELSDVVEGKPYVQRFAVDRASICFDCGHVMFALGSSALARLRLRAATLSPMPES